MYKIFCSVFVVSLISSAASEACGISDCVPKEQCVKFGKLSKKEQEVWQVKYPCEVPLGGSNGKFYGFNPVAKGDFVCCSYSLEPSAGDITGAKQSISSRFNNNPQNNYYDPRGNDYQNPNYGYDNGWNNNGNDRYPYQRNPRYQENQNPGRNNNFLQGNTPYPTPSPFVPGPGVGGVAGQCPLTSLPVDPSSGCCGREAGADRITGNNRGNGRWGARPRNPNYDNPSWQSWPNYDRQNRAKRSSEVNVTVGSRIAGGHETDFTQFPWTALLKTTFDYGNKRSSFNCGGSLISSKYVLTAGHCIYDEGGKMVGAEVYLAEYNKQTFPKDCRYVMGEGQKCIENVVMYAESALLHPQYDDSILANDIGLIRLQGNAPYTDYIRPICLPTIDIDTPDFSNLRLAVAGWGRNGKYRSDIKQSTIVNLVPQEQCVKYYPNLSRRSMCAAGYRGEDTCKGDSGGPLMTLYGGTYQVVGVVSGKRADAPCGTAVPSLYTNVYHYLDWIRSNIGN